MQNLLEDQGTDMKIEIQWITGAQNMNSTEITETGSGGGLL
jgi:hypothetical protein